MNTQDIMNQKTNKSPSSKGVGPAIAMTPGATLGVLFAPKEDAETYATVESIFGEVTKELEEDYRELRGNILAKLDDFHAKAELGKEKYDEVVKEVVEHFSKGKKWTEKSIKALIKQLQKELR